MKGFHMVYRRRSRIVFLIAICLFLEMGFSAFSVYAAEDKNDKEVDFGQVFLAEYEAILYDARSGLQSSTANAIAQTSDGYIWVGTYSGLYRYDGIKFERFSPDNGISNVMKLFVDSTGRLWIGTNDSGLYSYETLSGEVNKYTKENGLAADSIRAITEDSEGRIYVGTVAETNVIEPDGSIRVLSEREDVAGVRSLCTAGKYIAGVTNGGTLFLANDKEILVTKEYPESGIYYETVAYLDDALLLGTSENYIERLTFTDHSFRRINLIDTEYLNYINGILTTHLKDGFLFSAENGIGYVDVNFKVTDISCNGFDSSVSDLISDYQGNYWFVSNKQGILEYTHNPFEDIFIKAGMSYAVVNSLIMVGDNLYVARDNGLSIVDTTTWTEQDYDYLHYFDGVRIRHLLKDSKENLWVSTYGKDGLLCVTPEGQAIAFNEDSANTMGGRFRLCMELSDGTIVAATNMGLNFIKDSSEVVGRLGIEDGLQVPQILTMVERPDGSILAGSDGDGIYIIEDMKVTGRIGTEEGLNTLVVLRIVPCEGGYLYVTSNAIYYDDGKAIRRLNNFPYNNNYDVYITEDGTAWVSSSAGIYVVDLKDMLEDKEYHYTLLDYTRGLDTSLTANAWNTLLNDEGDLLLCCTNGVRRISTGKESEENEEYNILVKDVLGDDQSVYKDAAGTYVIPTDTKRIEIQVAILNYTLSNPLVRLYLEGAHDDGTTAYQNSLASLSYTNLPYGRYKLHVQILDGTTYECLRDEVFAIQKTPKFTELLVVRLGGIMLVMILVAFLVYRFMQATIIKQQYEQIRLAKDEAERANGAKSRFLANMSHEIRTPINTIMGMNEMILRENKKEAMDKYTSAVSEYAISVKRASESLLGLVNDILDLSKIESGKMNLVERDYEPQELFLGITNMIRVRASEKNLHFDTNISPKIPRRLYGDDGKIKQVLLNLLTNAVKYTKEGYFLLRAEYVEGNEESCRLRFSVKDTGIGIKPEDMERLFSAFERLDEQKNSGIQGTGLGLDISKQFVELMGDELKCESVYGKGSTFYFEVVQKVLDPEPIGEFKEMAVEETYEYVPLFAAPRAKILIVDDSPMNLQVISGLLENTRVQITTALSGKICLDLLRDDHFDLVLLDHMMPEMDGIETVHEIRKFNTEIPVLALTANSATSGEDYYVSEGFQGYLAKPIETAKLEEKIKEFLPEDLVEEWTPEENTGGTSTDAKSESYDFSCLSGIDPALGTKYCGSEKALFGALQTFRDTLPEREEEIRQAYEKEDWEFYTIKVHALKSSARMIGAEGLSKLAEEMEDAGKAGEIEKIRENTDRLLELYRSYETGLKDLEEADPAFAGNEAAEAGKPVADADTLADAWEALADIAEGMDYDSAEAVLESLREYALAPEDAEAFKQVEINLKALNWDRILELVKQHRG
ncbi:MAG: response regulator [Lachnospiraceae bacterium]|nr:response regulator [Lachnospiraceae bacterium]